MIGQPNRQFPGVVMQGVGHHFPSRVVTNDDLGGHLGVDDAWIVRHTGVSTRHWPGGDETHVTMARQACLQALDQAGLEAADVDMIIGSSATARHGANPTTATNRYADVALPLQRSLGAHKAACTDISGMACASFLMASLVARGLIATTQVRHVLVVCTENPVPILSERHRNRTLFGAGAAAAVWSRDEDTDHIRAAVVEADGRHYDAFDIDEDNRMIMRGKEVSDFAPQALADATTSVLAQAGLGVDDVDWIVPHQGNINIIKNVITRLGLPPDKVLTNIDRRGNTSSVSAPGCLSEYVHAGVVRPGDTVLTTMIGRGFTWGAMVFQFGRREGVR